jgi:hypothetical protein
LQKQKQDRQKLTQGNSLKPHRKQNPRDSGYIVIIYGTFYL